MVKKLLLGVAVLSLVAAAWMFWPGSGVRVEYPFGTVTLTQNVCTHKKILAMAVMLPPMSNSQEGISALKAGTLKTDEGTLALCYLNYDATSYFFMTEDGRQGTAPKKS